MKHRERVQYRTAERITRELLHIPHNAVIYPVHQHIVDMIHAELQQLDLELAKEPVTEAQAMAALVQP